MSWVWSEVQAPLAGTLCGSGSRSSWHPSIKGPQERQWPHKSTAHDVLDACSLFPTASIKISVRLPLGTINHAWPWQHPRLITTKHIQGIQIYTFSSLHHLPTGGKAYFFFIKGIPYVCLPHFRESPVKWSYWVVFPALAPPSGKVEFTDENPRTLSVTTCGFKAAEVCRMRSFRAGFWKRK